MCISKLSLSEICAAKTKGEDDFERRYVSLYQSGARSPVRINALLNLSHLYQTICIKNLEHFYDVKLPHHLDDTPDTEVLYAKAIVESKAALDRIMPVIRLELAIAEAATDVRQRFQEQNLVYRCLRGAFQECVTAKKIKTSGDMSPFNTPLPTTLHPA